MHIFRLSFSLLVIFSFFAGASAQKQRETPADRPLRIVSNPNADYPVEAQRALITGTVLLRISFLADGSIGATVCVNTDESQKLMFEKYGLLESAQTAARKIKFEVKIVNGKAVDVKATLGRGFHMR